MQHSMWPNEAGGTVLFQADPRQSGLTSMLHGPHPAPPVWPCQCQVDVRAASVRAVVGIARTASTAISRSAAA